MIPGYLKESVRGLRTEVCPWYNFEKQGRIFLMKQFEKVQLGLYPTPMHLLPNLSRDLGLELWIKRDDLCGVALGGNKVRKLEYLLAQARAQGCEMVMTTGQAQSNHAMLTAACALRLGMEPVLVLKKRGVTQCVGNQLLNRLMGARVVYVDTDDYQEIYREMDRIAAREGKKAYKIPCGGSNALGAAGYVDCMREIAQTGVKFDHMVCACGSGGTAAGCILGGAIALPETHVTAVMVDTDPFDRIVPQLMRETAALLETDVPIPKADLIDMCGPGYSIPSPEGNEAVAMMLRREGIVLDSCYTGKAFAGLLKRAREGFFRPGQRVLFLHTGGAGGLFSQEIDHLLP